MYNQDFAQDLQVTMSRLLTGPAFSLARFGDGERALVEGRGLKVQKPFESWESREGCPTRFTDQLQDSLTYTGPDYNVGISCPCCDAPAFHWYLGKVKVPRSQLTYANLWVNANWPVWVKFYYENKIRNKVVLVSSSTKGDFQVPQDAVTHEWGLEKLVAQLIQQADKPILLAAGPAANVIAYLYWTQVPQDKRQTVLDVGSSLDLDLHGEVTRCYQFPDKRSPYAQRVCHWG